MSCRNASTTQASGEANSSRSSFLAMARIMLRSPRSRSTAFLLGELHEHVFQAWRARRPGETSPQSRSTDCAHERVGRVLLGVRGSTRSSPSAAGSTPRDARAGAASLLGAAGGADPTSRAWPPRKRRSAVDGVAVDDAAAVHDLHAVAHRLHLGQDVGGQDHAVGARQLADQRADLADLVRVEPDGRLVEDDHVGVVDDRLRDADALLVALGQRADQPVADVGQAAALLGARPAPRQSGCAAPGAGAPRAAGTRRPSAPCRAAAPPAGSRCGPWPPWGAPAGRCRRC